MPIMTMSLVFYAFIMYITTKLLHPAHTASMHRPYTQRYTVYLRGGVKSGCRAAWLNLRSESMKKSQAERAKTSKKFPKASVKTRS